jgi:hypothetical protein
MVTWDALLRLEFRYQRYTRELRARAMSPYDDVHSSTLSHQPLEGSEKRPDDCNCATAFTEDTVNCIGLRQHTWDLLPAEVVRPIARSTLGCILILAQRLGMRWRSLDIKPADIHL